MLAKCYHKVKQKDKFRHNMIGLIEVRKKKKYNQQYVAMKLNISREALSYYENGKREPCFAMLNAMSKFFNVSIDYLINGKDFKKK